MGKMDRIEFEIYEYFDQYDSAGKLTLVRILINQTDLKVMLKAYEMPFALKEGHPSIAGGYADLFPGDLYRKLTVPDTFYSIDGKPAILVCPCRVEGCWPLMVEIEELENKVIWKNFLQPIRDKNNPNPWNYDEFGPFEFLKDNYKKELEKLKGMLTKHDFWYLEKQHSRKYSQLTRKR